MRKFVASLVLTGLLVPAAVAGPGTFAFGQTADPAKQAYDLLRKGDSLNREDKIDEAAQAYVDAAVLYEKALEQKPEDKNFLQNLKYCLGRPGYIRIQKAVKLMKEGKAAEAAGLYETAAADYERALTKYPDEKNFQQNLRYAKVNGGTARFRQLLESGGEAPAFDLPSVKEGRLRSSDIAGKVILVEFMAGWCPSCRDSLPVLQDIQNRYAGKPVQVVLLALDRVDGWKKSGSEKSTVDLTRDLTIPAAWADEETQIAYGSFSSIPTVILIGKDGRLVRQVDSNDRTKDRLIEYIDAALKK